MQEMNTQPGIQQAVEGNWQQARLKHYKMRPAEEINSAIADLPTATEMSLFAGKPDIGTHDLVDVEPFKAIKVHMNSGKDAGRDYFVACPSKRYKLVQHEKAFRPIIEGLTMAGLSQFGFLTVADERRAKLQIYASGEGHDTVSIGFEVINSFDGSHAISYGFRQTREKSVIEIVGYRQVCSNGMKIRVPLDEAEFVRPEIKTEVEQLLKTNIAIQHTKNAERRIEAMQYIVEAMALLRAPVEAMIQKAQKWTWKDQEHYEQLIETHVGKRFKSKIEDQLQNESQDLWGLYNAMTHVASHDNEIKDTARETILNKAANMMLIELRSTK